MNLNETVQEETVVGHEEPMKEESKCEESRYIPPANELRQRHQINIEFLSIGCVVRIGCKSFGFSDHTSAIKEINDYVNDPIAAYKKWSKELGVSLY